LPSFRDLVAEAAATSDNQMMWPTPSATPLLNGTFSINGENSTITASTSPTQLAGPASATVSASKSEAGTASSHILTSANLAIFVGAGMFFF